MKKYVLSIEREKIWFGMQHPTSVENFLHYLRNAEEPWFYVTCTGTFLVKLEAEHEPNNFFALIEKRCLNIIYSTAITFVFRKYYRMYILLTMRHHAGMFLEFGFNGLFAV